MRTPDLSSALAAARRHPFLIVAITAALARVVFAIVSFAVNDVSLIGDEGIYLGLGEAMAKGQAANDWYPGYGAGLFVHTSPFVAPIVVLFHVFGPIRLVAQLWSVVWGVATAVATARLAREVLSPGWALVSGVLVALLPSQVLWSSVVLRESMIWFVLVAMALVLARTADRSGVAAARGVAALGVLLLGLTFLRSQTAVVAAWAIVISCWAIPGRVRVQRAIAATALAAVIPALGGLGLFGLDLVTASVSSLGVARADLSFNASSAVTPTSIYTGALPGVDCARRPTTANTQPGAPSIAEIPSFTVETPDGETIEVVCSPNGPVVVDNSVGTNLRELPSGFAATVLRPYPWEWSSSVESQISGIENVVWYVLYALAAIGVWALRRRITVIAFPLVVTAGIIGASTLTQGNVGTAFRHRSQVLWCVALFAAAGAAHLVERRRSISAATPAA